MCKRLLSVAMVTLFTGVLCGTAHAQNEVVVSDTQVWSSFGQGNFDSGVTLRIVAGGNLTLTARDGIDDDRHMIIEKGGVFTANARLDTNSGGKITMNGGEFHSNVDCKFPDNSGDQNVQIWLYSGTMVFDGAGIQSFSDRGSTLYMGAGVFRAGNATGDETTPGSPAWNIEVIPGYGMYTITDLGDGWVEVSGESPFFAAGPYPEDGADDIVRDGLVLTWVPGEYAVTHDVYFGETFEDVNAATVPTYAGLDVNAVALDRLEFGKTYYWRVDEVNGAPDYAVTKGDVWSFTVEPYSLEIPGSTISVTASSASNDFSLPETTLDGSGLDADGAHATNPDTMWFSASPDLAPWIQYEFESVQKLESMIVWNSNSAAEMAIGWGVKEIEIVYSVDGENWEVLAGANQFSRAPGLPTYDQPDHIAFGAVAAKFVRLNIASNWGGMLMSYSLSEVQFTMIPAAARTPDPANGSVDVNPNATASWRAGRGAEHHLIYMDTDADAVAQGTASSTTTTTNALALDTLALDLDETYYWRVDEVNEAASPSTWEGTVWNFSTPATQSVDDFEGYDNLSPDRPFQTWLDGFGYSEDEYFPVGYAGNGTGSGVGHDIWSLSSPYYDGDIMETDRTRPGSSQSMPFYYTNTGGVASQIDRHWSPPQDWSGHGIQTLVLYFYGETANTGQLYLKINNTKIPYDGDASNLTKARWNPWHVDLSSLSVSSVTTLSIGVDGAGASGMILLDDIGLYRSAPAMVTPVAPSTEGLIAHWALDDGAGATATDSAGNNHGTIEGIVQWITGPLGGALKFDALNTYVDCGTGGALDITDVITLSVWVNPMDAGNGEHNPYVGKGDHAYAIKHAAGNSFEFYIHENGWHTVNAPVTNGFNDNWYHLAGTYDGAQVKLYVNGALSATLDYAGAIASSADAVNLGRNSEVTDRLFEGSMDDARIYHRVLSEAEILYLSNE